MHVLRIKDSHQQFFRTFSHLYKNHRAFPWEIHILCAARKKAIRSTCPVNGSDDPLGDRQQKITIGFQVFSYTDIITSS